MWPFKKKRPKYVKINKIRCPNDFLTAEETVIEINRRGPFTVYIEDANDEDWWTPETLGWAWYNEDDVRAFPAFRVGILHATEEGAAIACKARYNIKD